MILLLYLETLILYYQRGTGMKTENHQGVKLGAEAPAPCIYPSHQA